MIRDLLGLLNGSVTPLNFFAHLGAICFVIFCASPIHEYAHALIATKLGDDTPEKTGRLTINPKAHINPIGALMIFLFGFGYAQPVQVRMRNFKNPKRDMALVALAGPVSNLIQAFVFAFIAAALVDRGVGVLDYLGIFFLLAAGINVNLAVFNLLPVPPLDGSRLVTALLPSKYYFKLMQYERYIHIGLMVLLFTGVLTAPLSALSDFIMDLIITIVCIPFD
jgi:Zn-dependent protease